MIAGWWALSLALLGPAVQLKLLMIMNYIFNDTGWLMVFSAVTAYCAWAMVHPDDLKQRARAMLISLVLWAIVGMSVFMSTSIPVLIPTVAPYLGLVVGCFILFLNHSKRSRP